MTPFLQALIDANGDKTPAELVALAAAQPPTTAAPIPLDALAPLLRKTGLMLVLKSVAADAAADATLRAGVDAFLDQLADQRQKSLDTTDAEIATTAAQVLAALAPVARNNNIDPAAVTAAIYGLGGGLRYPAIAEQEVSDYRAAAAAAAKALQLRQQLGAGSTAAAERVAAYERGEQPEPTVDDLVALVRGALPA